MLISMRVEFPGSTRTRVDFADGQAAIAHRRSRLHAAGELEIGAMRNGRGAQTAGDRQHRPEQQAARNQNKQSHQSPFAHRLHSFTSIPSVNIRRWSTSSSWVESATRSRNWRTTRVLAVADFLDRPHGHDIAAVDQNDAVGDQEGAGQFVGHHHHAHGVGFLEVQDQIVDTRRGDRVQARGRFVEEQDLGIHGHGTGESGALLHASAQLRGAVDSRSRSAPPAPA